MDGRQGRLINEGHLEVPGELLLEMGLSDGDDLIMEVVGGVLYVSPVRSAHAKAADGVAER